MNFKTSYEMRFNSLAILTMVILSSLNLQGQTKRNSVSGDFSYAGFSEQISATIDHRRNYYVTGLSYNLSSALAFSVRGTLVRSNTADQPEQKEAGYQVSTLVEYDFLKKLDSRFYAGFGLAIGNYCTCGTLLPRVTENLLTYSKVEIGVSYPLLPPISVHAGFEANFILTAVPDRINFNFPKIGLRINDILQLGRSKRN